MTMTIKLAPELEQTLRQRSAALGRPASALIREALQTWMEATPPPRVSAYALGEKLFGRHRGPTRLAATRKQGLANAWDAKHSGRALLVTDKSSAHQVKKAVDLLKTQKQQTVQLPAVVHRPWGTCASLNEEDDYKVKRITIKPGEALSLQYHHERAGHWVVVKGRAIVQVGDAEHETLPGQYCYIPLKEKHRLTNVGTDDLVLIEVQCGGYVDEDDIVRVADTYGRAKAITRGTKSA